MFKSKLKSNIDPRANTIATKAIKLDFKVFINSFAKITPNNAKIIPTHSKSNSNKNDAMIEHNRAIDFNPSAFKYFQRFQHK